MGRPKGSKNKAREEVVREAAQQFVADQNIIAEVLSEAEAPAPRPAPITVTMTLTDEDLAPARQAKLAHERAAQKYQQDEIASELRRKESGEISDLSVPQVAPFDMSGRFVKTAQQKARTAGYRFAHNLRKTAEGWVFEASNSPKVINDSSPDQL
jgi:hypothetical protein